VPVSHDLRCIFVHVPRTGGTSIETALGLKGDWRIENTHSMFGRITSPDLKQRIKSTDYLQHLTANELRSLLLHEFQNYYRFAFVRNPWDRMVSIYCHMDPHMKLEAEPGRPFTGTSFGEFLEWSENITDAHLAPQYTYLYAANGACLLDFVGRFEQLDQDFGRICAHLGVRLELPRVNASVRADYRDYYNDTTRRLIERRYGEDVERFGYRF